ncbi:KH domain-containing protein [Pseudalkalibacillus hwajinpoensis]|uniref:RNA-binding protein KhpA n=1 Tax=Guptibacillus hwajinpoensis TaxID=208199 RepID=A0A4U1MM87_9BACL|nr:KH domain-containing protein [Pseudalkalibacillus hwajinpoensis]TKD71682.1 KH domain-containing protein [Pseudalkalibacillus hwajinpoensis]
MEALVETIVKALVDHPEDVRIEKEETNNLEIYKLHVHSNDTGKVIGKQGKVARSIRTVMNAAAVQSNKRVQLEIL